MTVYTLSTLANAVAGDKPAKLAVLGFPVTHSASPKMHQPALDQAGHHCCYIALEIEPQQIGTAFTQLQDLGFIGCNITVPHKFEALAACTQIDQAARDLGAVNTVGFENNKIMGTNTDGYGFEKAIQDAFGIKLRNQRVLIVGAGGGAGGAIAAHCVRQGVNRLVLVNRTLSKLESLAKRLQKLDPRKDLEISVLSSTNFAEIEKLSNTMNLLVNTSSLGLKPDDPSPLDSTCFNSDQYVFDTIYQPSQTHFLKVAADAGCRTANGAGMLLHQGVKAFQFWFPNSEPEKAMRLGLGL